MNDFINYKFFYNPRKFTIENLIFSDAMGNENNKSFLIDRNYFNNNLIMYVISGTLFVEQNGIKHKINANQGILMDLTKKHKYYFDKTTSGNIIWLHFRGNPCQPLINEMNKFHKLPLVFISDTIKNDILDIFKINKSQNNKKEFEISSKLYSVLLDLTQDKLLEIQNTFDNFSSFISEVDNYITIKLDSKMTLDHFADHFNISKYHFCRKFKKELNTTLFDYIKNKKIDIARKMLLHTNDSIADISNYLNFYDQGYFSNIFKSIVGCSPTEYRAKN